MSDSMMTREQLAVGISQSQQVLLDRRRGRQRPRSAQAKEQHAYYLDQLKHAYADVLLRVDHSKLWINVKPLVDIPDADISGHLREETLEWLCDRQNVKYESEEYAKLLSKKLAEITPGVSLIQSVAPWCFRLSRADVLAASRRTKTSCTTSFAKK